MFILFSFISRSNCSLSILLLIVFSVNTFAQIHIAENTVLSIKENTVLYTADKTLETILDAEKKTGSKKQKVAAKNQKKSKKPLQPPIVEKDTEPEKEKSVLSFKSKGKVPSALFYSGKTTGVALINSGSFSIKIFPPKKPYNNTIHSFLLNDHDQEIRTSFHILPKTQIHLEEQITRPPPILTKSYSKIS